MSGHVDQVSADIVEDMRHWVAMKETPRDEWMAGSNGPTDGMQDYEVLAHVDANYAGGAAQYVEDHKEAWS